MRSGSSMRTSNAQSYVIKETQNELETLGWETVPHPPCSPGLAPSNYHLFRPLKQFLASKSFVKYEDLKLAISDFFDPVARVLDQGNQRSSHSLDYCC
ncbi:hypothetical protein WR25_12992 [Diploscapter pachys]|uniref:Histone-lysine N-methyltransferase SETMAR n=1 Tax=Diploscapter pachys TaxID=2018661 RepID=A0A2A2LKC3_9BILA|nr:hypothetical protein WR25_12992 [Diploscapter pachys]